MTLSTPGISCGDPGSSPHSTHTGSYWYQDTVIYTCDPGYKLAAGDVVLECMANGQWDGTLPACKGMMYLRTYEVTLNENK